MLNRLVEILSKLRLRRPRSATLAFVFLVGYSLSTCLTVGASRLSAQVSSTRLVHVAVTDGFGRSVTGLEPRGFQVFENGALCPIAGFSGADSPMTIVIVSETPFAEVGKFIRPEDDLIQTRSFADALRQAQASKKSRKVILTMIPSSTEAVSEGIQVLPTTPANLSDAVAELGRLHQYLLWIRSSTPSSNLNVVLERQPDLPPLRLAWN